MAGPTVAFQAELARGHGGRARVVALLCPASDDRVVAVLQSMCENKLQLAHLQKEEEERRRKKEKRRRRKKKKEGEEAEERRRRRRRELSVFLTFPPFRFLSFLTLLPDNKLPVKSSRFLQNVVPYQQKNSCSKSNSWDSHDYQGGR